MGIKKGKNQVVVGEVLALDLLNLAKPLFNIGLHLTRLRRVATGRFHSQAFGLANFLDYHRRAAELNR